MNESAGATKGPKEAEQPAPTSLKTHAPEPATLSALALGAPGLAIWRREDWTRAALIQCHRFPHYLFDDGSIWNFERPVFR